MTVKLDTLVHHVCEHTGEISIPDVDDVYEQLVALDGDKYPNLLLLPEYNGHENWTEELQWIEDNFGGARGG
jgi:hypothetical protein